jgi:hypothetical protein
MIGLTVPNADFVTPPFDEAHVTVNAAMALPPSLSGTANETEAPAFRLDDTTDRGAVGTVAGTKALDAADGALVPTLFVAVTVHVYDFPFVSPDTMIGLTVPNADFVTPPFDEAHVTVNAVIGLPPFAPAV